MPTSVITYGSGLEFFIFPVTQSVNRCLAKKKQKSVNCYYKLCMALLSHKLVSVHKNKKT